VDKEQTSTTYVATNSDTITAPKMTNITISSVSTVWGFIFDPEVALSQSKEVSLCISAW
jgi:hypothetical protein